MYILSVYTMMIYTELKEWGNSYGIRVTKEQARRMKLREGEQVKVKVKKNEIESAFGILKGKKLGPFERDHDDRF